MDVISSDEETAPDTKKVKLPGGIVCDLNAIIEAVKNLQIKCSGCSSFSLFELELSGCGAYMREMWTQGCPRTSV